MSLKITLSSAAVLCGALALSACQSATPAASAPGTSAPAAPSTTGSASPASSVSSAGETGSAPAPSTGSTTPRGAKPSSGAPAGPHNDDSYAFTHPCAISQLTLQVTRMTDVPTRRLITVRDNATTSCGLSYYPLVDLGSSKSADRGRDVKPLIPGGLGGPPAYVLHANKTAYAVLDLDPAGSGSGPATTLDVINVLASATMPNAATKNFPLGGGSVALPKLGLYEDRVADAVASMQGANTPQR